MELGFTLDLAVLGFKRSRKQLERLCVKDRIRQEPRLVDLYADFKAHENILS